MNTNPNMDWLEEPLPAHRLTIRKQISGDFFSVGCHHIVVPIKSSLLHSMPGPGPSTLHSYVFVTKHRLLATTSAHRFTSVKAGAWGSCDRRLGSAPPEPMYIALVLSNSSGGVPKESLK